VFQEGLRLPPVRLIEGGNLNEAVWAIIGQNVRKPVLMLGDLQSQLASLNVGSAAIIRLAERYSTEGLKAAMTQILDMSETLMRAAIRAMPDGAYESRISSTTMVCRTAPCASMLNSRSRETPLRSISPPAQTSSEALSTARRHVELRGLLRAHRRSRRRCPRQCRLLPPDHYYPPARRHHRLPSAGIRGASRGCYTPARVVETAPVAVFFENPAHPYSRRLLRVATAAHETTPLAGGPTVRERTAGLDHMCSFAPRCPIALPTCRQATVPLLRTIGPNRAARCIRAPEIMSGTVNPWP
jgi:oligopeptide/dipeptide ABC transporter ATP-binding protein